MAFDHYWWIHGQWSVATQIDKFIFHIVIWENFYADIRPIIMLDNYNLNSDMRFSLDHHMHVGKGAG